MQNGIQGEAIAVNLREMFGFRVPIISIVIGEGGSGGALAINCANKVLIMENAVYYVASPEACAAILWKSREKAGEVSDVCSLYIHHHPFTVPWFIVFCVKSVAMAGFSSTYI